MPMPNWLIASSPKEVFNASNTQPLAPIAKPLKAKPEDIREQYEKQIKQLQEAYGEAMLELRARKKLQSLLGEDEK